MALDHADIVKQVGGRAVGTEDEAHLQVVCR